MRKPYEPFDTWPEQVKNLFYEHRVVCPYCGLGGAADYRIRRLFDTDHIVPNQADSAYDSPLNKILCCHGCNHNKRSDGLHEETSRRAML